MPTRFKIPDGMSALAVMHDRQHIHDGDHFQEDGWITNPNLPPRKWLQEINSNGRHYLVWHPRLEDRGCLAKVEMLRWKAHSRYLREARKYREIIANLLDYRPNVIGESKGQGGFSDGRMIVQWNTHHNAVTYEWAAHRPMPEDVVEDQAVIDAYIKHSVVCDQEYSRYDCANYVLDLIVNHIFPWHDKNITALELQVNGRLYVFVRSGFRLDAVVKPENSQILNIQA